MGTVPVLGAVTFQGFEVPERISLGGRQQLAVHELPGGGRVVDAMGADETPIHWSGVFSGQDAAARVRTLEQMRRSGSIWPLSWDAWRFTVVIQEFRADVSNPWWIPYSVKLYVLPDVSLATVDAAIEAASATELAGLSSGSDLDGQIATASAGLSAGALGDVVAASGQLAQLVSARALVESKL